MEEREFTLKSEFTFKVTEDVKGEVSFKDAFDKGIITITQSRITLTEPDGNVLSAEHAVLNDIRQAIIYGLREKA